jgi:multidrug efflux pump subunit AcrA (membrane-fusion protein)
MDFSSWPPMKNFTLDVKIDRTDPRIKPGMKANARIAVNTIPNSVLVPTQALFRNNGSTVVYVESGSRFDERTVKVGHRSGETAQILEGLQPGERVSLKSPTEVAASK